MKKQKRKFITPKWILDELVKPDDLHKVVIINGKKAVVAK